METFISLFNDLVTSISRWNKTLMVIVVLVLILLVALANAVYIKRRITSIPPFFKKLLNLFSFGIREKATRKGLFISGILCALIAFFVYFYSSNSNGFTHLTGVATLAAFLLAIIGIAQQYEILQKQREQIVVQQARLETDIPSVLNKVFMDFDEYGLKYTTEIHALLASPAFGILGGPEVFAEFVKLIDGWLLSHTQSTRTLVLHLWNTETHQAFFGAKTGHFRHRIYVPDATKNKNLHNIARLVALAQCSNMNPTLLKFGISCYHYDNLTDFRMILAKGPEKRLSAVMAFSDKYRYVKDEENGVDTSQSVLSAVHGGDLDCMTTFATHNDTYKTAEKLLRKYCKYDKAPVPFTADSIADYFQFDDSCKADFQKMIQKHMKDILKVQGMNDEFSGST